MQHRDERGSRHSQAQHDHLDTRVVHSRNAFDHDNCSRGQVPIKKCPGDLELILVKVFSFSNPVDTRDYCKYLALLEFEYILRYQFSSEVLLRGLVGPLLIKVLLCLVPVEHDRIGQIILFEEADERVEDFGAIFVVQRHVDIIFEL